MRHLVEKAGLEHQFLLDSAGTSGHHAGDPPDIRAIEAASQRGIVISGKSRPFRPQDFKDFDEILAMDPSNLAHLRTLDPQDKWKPKVKLMTDYCAQFQANEIPDPYYGGDQGFHHVLDLLEDACAQLLKKKTQAP